MYTAATATMLTLPANPRVLGGKAAWRTSGLDDLISSHFTHIYNRFLISFALLGALIGFTCWLQLATEKTLVVKLQHI